MTALIDRLTSLADQTRCRLLLLLERQALTVGELRDVLQLPQSTVSRHLKLLADEHWITSRAEGASNWYRVNPELDPAAARLWQVVREQVAGTPPARRDAERVKEIVSARHHRTREFFATDAGRWDQLRAELFGDGLEWRALAGLLDPAAVVADLGAGTGLLSAALGPMVRQVIAVDESAVMLEAARERTRDAGNVDCRQGTLEALPIASGTVTLAFAVLVLHHLSAPELAVAEAARILAPGGRLVVVDMMPHERAEYRETMGHQWLGFPADTMTGWFETAGLAAPTWRALPPRTETKGPLLFVAVAGKLHEEAIR